LRGRCGRCPAGKPLLHGPARAEIDQPFAVDAGEVARDGVGRADADEGTRPCRGGADPHVAQDRVEVARIGIGCGAGTVQLDGVEEEGIAAAGEAPRAGGTGGPSTYSAHQL
jgi:hypothetical protein